jgi:molecular chaperone DnaK
MAVNRVKEAAEKAKIELSTVMETEINLPYVSATQAGPKHLALKLSRAKLEQLIEPIIKRCLNPFESALKDAKLTKDDIQKVILVGGPTRMPVVQKFIEDHVGKKMERGIDPMECVAMGAAIQGAILGGEITDMVLLDVTPLTLGLETLGGVRTALIDRNTTIPTRKSQTFSTAADMQTSVTIHVLQGERPMAADNVSLGQFNLVGLPPAPRGVPQIDVTFDIDASGILNVSAKDLGTGKEQKMTITASTKLADADVKKMVNDAKQYEEQDKARKEEVEARNVADSLVYTAEKTKSDLADKLNADILDPPERGDHRRQGSAGRQRYHRNPVRDREAPEGARGSRVRCIPADRPAAGRSPGSITRCGFHRGSRRPGQRKRCRRRFQGS